jgi:chromosome partition protein MukE
LLPEERIRLRSSLMRFAEPVRGSGADLEALTRLVASGEISLAEEATEEPGEEPQERAVKRGPQAMPVKEWNEGSEWGSSFESAAEEPNADAPPAEYVSESPGTEPEAPKPEAPAPAPFIEPLPGDDQEWSYGGDEEEREEELP